MVSVLNWGVIFQIHHMIEKVWWWGMITNELKSPNDLNLDVKNQDIADMEAAYIMLLCHVTYNIILSSGWY